MTQKLVYSTRTGDLRAQTTSQPKITQSRPTAQQQIRVRLEKKGRKGKSVTVAYGFALTADDLKSLTKALKSSCGTGGTSKIEADGSQQIEIQGDQRDKVLEKLLALGYKAKRAGG